MNERIRWEVGEELGLRERMRGETAVIEVTDEHYGSLVQWKLAIISECNLNEFYK